MSHRNQCRTGIWMQTVWLQNPRSWPLNYYLHCHNESIRVSYGYQVASLPVLTLSISPEQSLKISNIRFACTGMRGFSVWLLPTANSYTPHKPATCYSPDPLDVSTVVGSPTGSTNSKEILKTTERNESKVYHSKWISYARTGEWGPRCLHPFSRGSCSDWCAQTSSEVCPSSTKLSRTCGWTWRAWVGLADSTGRRKIAYKRNSPYGVRGGEDPGFPAQSWRHGSSQGHSCGQFCLILPVGQRPCFHLCAGQGGHTKLEVNFLCRNASSRAKKRVGGRYGIICWSNKQCAFHSQYLLLLSQSSTSPSLLRSNSLKRQLSQQKWREKNSSFKRLLRLIVEPMACENKLGFLKAWLLNIEPQIPGQLLE